jgi:hypothetical protein
MMKYGFSDFKSKLTSRAVSSALGLSCAAVMSLTATPVHAETLCGYTIDGAIGAYLKANLAGFGCPTSNMYSWNGGYAQDTANGFTAIWSANTGAPHYLHGAIKDYFRRAYLLLEFIGFPINSEYPWAGGYAQDTDKGYTVAWSAATGAHLMNGAIRAYTVSNVSWLGFPASDIYPWNTGYAQDTVNGYTVVWSSNTGSHYLHGELRKCILNYANTRGYVWLGFPSSNERKLGDTYWVQPTTKRNVYWSGAKGCYTN